MRCVVIMLIATALCGCASTSSVSHGVKVTRDAADVEHCKHIGAVQSVPPYSLPARTGADSQSRPGSRRRHGLTQHVAK